MSCSHPHDTVCSACPRPERSPEQSAESRQAAAEIGAMWATEERAYAERCRDLAEKWKREAVTDREEDS